MRLIAVVMTYLVAALPRTAGVQPLPPVSVPAARSAAAVAAAAAIGLSTPHRAVLQDLLEQIGEAGLALAPRVTIRQPGPLTLPWQPSDGACAAGGPDLHLSIQPPPASSAEEREIGQALRAFLHRSAMPPGEVVIAEVLPRWPRLILPDGMAAGDFAFRQGLAAQDRHLLHTDAGGTQTVVPMRPFIGSLISSDGNNALVYRFGADKAIKIFGSGVPGNEVPDALWTLARAEHKALMADARAQGIRAVEAIGPVEVDGYPALVFELMAQGSKSFERDFRPCGTVAIGAGVERLNAHTIRTSRELWNGLVARGIYPHDPQGLLDFRGGIWLADPGRMDRYDHLHIYLFNAFLGPMVRAARANLASGERFDALAETPRPVRGNAGDYGFVISREEPEAVLQAGGLFGAAIQCDFSAMGLHRTVGEAKAAYAFAKSGATDERTGWLYVVRLAGRGIWERPGVETAIQTADIHGWRPMDPFSYYIGPYERNPAADPVADERPFAVALVRQRSPSERMVR